MSRSAVVESEFRPEIDKLLKEGKSARFVSNWLKENGEFISHTTINTYKKNKLNIDKEAVIRYNEKKSQEFKDSAVDGRVAEIESLQRFAREALGVELASDFVLDERTTVLDVEKHKLNIKKAGVYAQKVVNDFLKVLEPDSTVNVSVELSLDERVKEYERRFKSSRDGGDSGDGV